MGSQQRSSVDSNELQLPNSLIRVTRKSKAQGSKIVWAGPSLICGKGLRHYPAFQRDKTFVTVHSFVFVLAEGGGHYVGYVEDLYDDEKGSKKATIRWFLHNREVKEVPELDFDPREIIITPYVQAVSVECIEGFAIVLTPVRYEKILAVVSLDVSTRIHVCCREIVNNNVKPFSLWSLLGYSCQPILACLEWPRSIRIQLDNNEIEISNPKEDEIKETESPAKKIKTKFPNGGEKSINLVEPKAPNHALLNPGQKIEVLCQDAGLRGCWFRCTILKASRQCLKVQHVHVLNVDDSSTLLKEWVPAHRVASSDKLGMRVEGRPTIRPYPPESADCFYNIGTAVDMWRCDGWWEGVVIGLRKSRTHPILFYSPGENMTMAVDIKDLRLSRDWVGEKWTDIMPKMDILALIPSSALRYAVKVGVDERIPLHICDEDNEEDVGDARYGGNGTM